MTNSVYNTPAWKHVRKVCIARDGYRCQIRLPGCAGRATTADHIRELDDGGAMYDLANLQAACRHCNTAKRNASVAQRAKRMGAQRRW